MLAPAHGCTLWKRSWSQVPGWELQPAACSLLETEGLRRWISHSVSAESANGDQNSRIFTCCGNPVGAVPGLRFPSVVRAQSLRVSCPGGCVSLCRREAAPTQACRDLGFLSPTHVQHASHRVGWNPPGDGNVNSVSHGLSSAPSLRHHAGPPRRPSDPVTPFPSWYGLSSLVRLIY